MAYDDFEKSLRSMVENEFAKRDSNLHEEIEIEFSRLAAKQQLSSGVGVKNTTDLCIEDLTERVHYIYTKIKIIVDAQNYSHSKELQDRAKELFIEFSETAKVNCSDICSEAVNKINTGSVEGCLNKIDHKFQLEQHEALNEMGIYFDELKNKPTNTLLDRLMRFAKEISWIIITTSITAIVGFIGYLIKKAYFE